MTDFTFEDTRAARNEGGIEMATMRPESTPELIERARQLALEKPSTSYVQRKLMIGYNHACELMEHFEEEGIISKRNFAGMRTVLVREPQ